MREVKVPSSLPHRNSRPKMPKKTRPRYVAVPKIDQTLSCPRRPFVYIPSEPAHLQWQKGSDGAYILIIGIYAGSLKWAVGMAACSVPIAPVIVPVVVSVTIPMVVMSVAIPSVLLPVMNRFRDDVSGCWVGTDISWLVPCGRRD